MKLGVFTVLLGQRPLEEALSYLKSLGVQMVEIGCGGNPGTAHADPDVLLNDARALDTFRKTVENSGLAISALSAHGNPVHPNAELAQSYDRQLKNAVLLAEKLGVPVVNTFSGCPGDFEGAKYPNWVTCPWPDDFAKVLEWQWNEKLIPYWRDFVKFAKRHGVNRIAFELHPGFCVYNTESMLKIRDAVGPEIGANLDPSHLFWQGMDPVAVIRKLGDAIFHFHAKDTKIDPYNTAVNGVLDTTPYADGSHRSWVFRSMGYGHDNVVWKDIFSALRTAGYDYAVSVEHEDDLMSTREGLEKSIEFLKQSIIFEDTKEKWWA